MREKARHAPRPEAVPPRSAHKKEPPTGATLESGIGPCYRGTWRASATTPHPAAYSRRVIGLAERATHGIDRREQGEQAEPADGSRRCALAQGEHDGGRYGPILEGNIAREESSLDRRRISAAKLAGGTLEACPLGPSRKGKAGLGVRRRHRSAEPIAGELPGSGPRPPRRVRGRTAPPDQHAAGRQGLGKHDGSE